MALWRPPILIQGIVNQITALLLLLVKWPGLTVYEH